MRDFTQEQVAVLEALRALAPEKGLVTREAREAALSALADVGLTLGDALRYSQAHPGEAVDVWDGVLWQATAEEEDGLALDLDALLASEFAGEGGEWEDGEAPETASLEPTPQDLTRAGRALPATGARRLAPARTRFVVGDEDGAP